VTICKFICFLYFLYNTFENPTRVKSHGESQFILVSDFVHA
jgi:hypothetical protein